MNRSTLFHWLLLASLLVTVSAVEAQVTIGSGKPPLDGALLDLKQDGPDSENITSKKGMLYPRVKLTDKDNLFPMFDNDGSGGYKTGSQPRIKADEDKSHTGLVVYNITNEKGFLPGLHMWDGKTWRKIEDIPVVESKVESLLCNAVTIIPDDYTAGKAYDGILKIPYTGGNGGLYPGSAPTSIGNGLFMERIGGRLAEGGGEITYHIIGTPTVSSPTLTTFPVSFLNKNCNITMGSGDVKSIYVKNLSKNIVVDEQYKDNSAHTADELTFEGGRVKITETGTYVFSLRLYGEIIKGKTTDDARQTYYIYLSRYNQSKQTVLDAAELDLITPTVTRPDFSYSVTLGAAFQAGDEVIIGMHSPVVSEANTTRTWTLWKNNCTSGHISACPVRTSMVYWKL